MSELLDPVFLLGQLRSGLTTAMFLFLIASGLSLIFGVLKIINFAHGSLYMIGAYIAWNMTLILGKTSLGFLGAVVVASVSVAILGGLVERFLLRYMYKREELYQLLFTYALVLIFSDACKFIWGTQPHSVSRPPTAGGQLRSLRRALSALRSVHHLLGPLIALGFWLLLNRTQLRPHHPRRRARSRDAGRAGHQRVGALSSAMFVLASFLAGLSGALVSPIKSVVPGMDVEIIIEAFIVVVIGGLGSLWGTLLGSLIYGLTLAFGILIFPRFSIFAAFVIMAVVLDRAAVGPAGEAGEVSLPKRIPWTLVLFLIAIFIPAVRVPLLHVPGDRHHHLRACSRPASTCCWV